MIEVTVALMCVREIAWAHLVPAAGPWSDGDDDDRSNNKIDDRAS